MNILFVVLANLVLFLVLVVIMAAKPKFTAKATRTIFVIVAVTGLFFYGYGFMATIFGYAMFCLLVSPIWVKKLAYRIFR
jgi:hypothetical protein